MAWIQKEHDRRGEEADHDHKHLLEASLRDLRNRHRLAMHVWEGTESTIPDVGTFPSFSWNAIRATPADCIDAMLEEGDPHLLSMSVLPSTRSLMSMRPFQTKRDTIGGLSYLVNLDQEQEYPPRVVRVGLTSLFSGSDPLDKCLMLERSGLIPELVDYYTGLTYPRTRTVIEQDVMRSMTGPQGKERCEYQLDMLGRQYESCNLSPAAVEYPYERIAIFNEAIVSLAPRNVSAIAVPIFAGEHSPASYEPAQKLAGAIAGIQHFDRGIDLPVVSYQVSPVGHGASCAQGDCAYLAKGREELVQLALNSIRELQSTNDTARLGEDFQKLAKAVRQLLHIDMEIPLSDQAAALMELRPESKSIHL